MSAPVRSLADDLRQRDDAALTRLLQQRPDLAHPLPSDLGQLAARSVTQAATSRAIDRLNQFELQVLETVVALAEPIDPPSVHRHLEDASPDDIDVVLDHLTVSALIWGPASARRTTAMVKEVFGRFPAGLGPPLSELGPTAQLEELIEKLAAAPPDVNEVLARLTWGPPHGRVADALRPVTEASAETSIEWLLARGLLVSTDKTTVMLPREIGLHLRGGRVHRQTHAVIPELAYTDLDVHAVDRAAAGTAFDVVRRIEDLLEGWAIDPPSVLRAGGVGVRDVRAVAARFDVDEASAAFLVEMAFAAGMLASSGDVDDVWLPTPAYDVWRTRPTPERWVEIAGVWLETTRVPGLVGPAGANDARVNALTTEIDRVVAPDIRMSVLQDFVDAPPASVIDVPSLVARQEWRRPRRGGRLRDELVRWTVSEAAEIGLTALGALSTPGRALLSSEAADAAQSLAALLPSPVDHVLLQGDLTAIAPGPLDGDVAREIGLMAEVESSGGATVFRFTDGSIRRALDAGRSAIDLHAFLQHHSRTAVPQPLTYLIDDVARRHGQVRVGAASAYVRSDDPRLLDEVAVDRRMAALRIRRLAPTVIATGATPDVVLGQLRQMGLAPAAESTDGTLLVRRRDSRRTGPRQRPPRLLADPPPPPETVAAAAVRALRAGERGAELRDPVQGPGANAELPKTAVTETLALLNDAVANKRSVWLGYVSTDGMTVERVVDPVGIRGGWLTAYDHRVEQVRTFAVHRITGVAPLDATP